MKSNYDEFFIKIGKRVAKYRKAKKLTQENLSRQLGVKQSAIASYEIGRRRLPLSFLLPISELLDVSIEELLNTKKETNKRGPKSALQIKLEKIHQLPVNKKKLVIELLDTIIQSTNKAS